MKVKIVEWASSHKLIVLLSLSTFSFFVSTVALSVHNNNSDKLCDTQNSYSIADATKSTTRENNVSNYRLSRHVRPLNYKLRLEPDLMKKTFVGHVEIKMRISQPITRFEVHLKDLLILNKHFNGEQDKNIIINSTKEIEEREVIQFCFANDVAQGDYTLTLDFTGKLDKGIVGFYESQMRNGKIRYPKKHTEGIVTQKSGTHVMILK